MWVFPTIAIQIPIISKIEEKQVELSRSSLLHVTLAGLILVFKEIKFFIGL